MLNRPIIYSSALFVAAFFTAASTMPVSAMPAKTLADDDAIEFLDDYNAAIKEAKATGRPIFLEFRCAP